MKILLRLLYFFWNFVGLGMSWYSLTMKFSKNRHFQVMPVDQAWKIADRLDWGRRYRKDKWDGKLDNLTHPTEIQRRIDRLLEIGDCDDHSIYWATCLLKSDLVLKVWFSFFQMQNKETGKLSGHVVCVFVDKDNKMKWCDYRKPKEITSRWNWAEQSAELYGAKPITAAMVEVVEVREDDTPVFGEIDKKIWK